MAYRSRKRSKTKRAGPKQATMITVYYGGTMTGYHSVGRQGVKLVPGENKVHYELGQALIDAGIVVEVKEKPIYTEETESETEQAGQEEL